MEDSQAIAEIIRALDWSEQISNEPAMQTQAQVANRIEHCLREENHTILVAERRPDSSEQGVPSSSLAASTQGTVIGYVAVHWFFHLRGSDGYVSELFLRPWDLYDHRVLGRNASLTVMVNGTESQEGEMTFTITMCGPTLPKEGVTVTVPIEHHREMG